MPPDTIDAPSRRGHGAGVPRVRCQPAEPRSTRLIAEGLARPPDLHAAKDGPCPGCRHFERCTHELIVCDAFLIFARLGSDYSAERWRIAPRFPSAAIFERMLLPR
jgi:hypothetical protein